MASGIAITPERLRWISGRMNDGAAEVKGILSGLASNVARVRSEWAGSSQAQFNVLWAELQRDASGLQSVLIGIAKLTENAAGAHQGTEQTIARTFDEFRAELDKLSDLLGPAQDGPPAPALSGDGAKNLSEGEIDTNWIDQDLAQDDGTEDVEGSVAAAQKGLRLPWARFMTPIAWRQIEAGRN